MSERTGNDRIYRRVLGIGLLVSLAVHGAILAWGRLDVPSAADADDAAEPKTQLALTYADEEPLELIDVRVIEADVVAETAPAPDVETSTAPAALDLDPPKLAAAQQGSMILVSLVEEDDSDIGSAVEYDRLGAAVAAANQGGNDHDFERLGGFRIPEASGGRGPLIIGGGGSGCEGPRVRLPGSSIPGFTGIRVGGIGVRSP
jgi:hypothetical protein